MRGGRARIGYIGTLSDGSVFDQGQYTFTFGEGQVITGNASAFDRLPPLGPVRYSCVETSETGECSNEQGLADHRR